MKYWIQKLVLIFIVLILSACGGHKTPPKTIIKLEVQPLENIYIQHDERSNSFRIGNELVERTIIVNKEANRIFTSTYVNKLAQHNYVNSLSEEFSLRINETQISGVTGNIEYKSYNIYSEIDVKGLELSFDAKIENVGTINLKLIYEVYPHIPAIRKWLEVDNKTGSSVTIDSIMMESLSLLPGLDFDIDVGEFSEYLGKKNLRGLSPVVFNTNLKEGFIVGNETPGILKYYDVYSKPGRVAIGMTSQGSQYAHQLQLMPKEVFTSPGAFIFLFKDEPEKSKEIFSKLIHEYIAPNKELEYSVSFENISSNTTESVLMERAKYARDSGADIFCISGDWTDKRGDWTYEKNAYIKNISEEIHGLGMKFGLCVDLAVAEPESIILDQHPQWAVKLKNGSDYEIADSKAKLMCLGGEYSLYMAYEIDALVKELNLDYVKLTGEMLPLGDEVGCFAEDHLHKISGESIWYIYDGLFAIMKYLHAKNWELIVDISLDSYNPAGLIDYALLKDADISWKSD